MALKTTFRGSPWTIFIQSWCIETKNLWNFLLFNIHHLREIYCLFKLKSLLELVINLTLMNVGEDEMANNLGLQIIAFLYYFE